MTALASRSQGLSLVELLVGLALGLFVVAAATTLLASSWREQRQLMVENRLMQDLRTATDVIARDVRRAGFWASAAAASSAASNPYAALSQPAGASGPLGYRYSRDAVENNQLDANEEFGLRLRNGAIELALGAGQWQSLTDAGTLTVTAFEIVPTVHELSLEDHCAAPCPAGSATCPPRQQVRHLAIAISARSPLDAAVVRSLRSDVRLRNDAVSGACPS